MTRLVSLLLLLMLVLCAGAVLGEIRDEFDAPSLPGWRQTQGALWSAYGGVLKPPQSCSSPCLLLSEELARNVALKVDVKLPETGRRNVGMALRMTADGTGYVVRWYDRQQWLELIRYERGQVVRVDGNHWQATSPAGSAPQKPGQWYTLAVDVSGEQLRAKVWPHHKAEPKWLLRANVPDTTAGAYGIGADQAAARFDNLVAETGRAQEESLQGESLQGESLQGESLQGESLQGESLQGESLQAESLLAESHQAVGREGEDLRSKPVELQEDALLQYGVVTGAFRMFGAVGEQGPELVFRARDVDNYLFVRADSEGLVLGKVVAAEESVLAAIKADWAGGPGEYLVEASVSESTRDDKASAWFINRLRVPPQLQINATVGRADGLHAEVSISTRDDSIVPGNTGEPYWYPDPFSSSSARVVLGSRLGWRRADGVEWLTIRTQPRLLEERGSQIVEPVLRIGTEDRGGCWLALGDLDHDQRLDYLVARNEAQVVTALTAYANDGRELWRWGRGGSTDITYDVPATVYDIDHDGQSEVLCSIEGHLLVLDGATGREEVRWPLPEGLAVADTIIVANLRGLEKPSDILVKTRYDDLWAYTNDWVPLWEFHGNTGHHPDVRDVDGDGRDEVLCGFTLLDDDGEKLWQQDLPEHADAARLVALEPGGPVRALSTCCGGNDMVLTTLAGDTIWRQRPEVFFHFQTTHVGEIRPDVPGYGIIADEGWARAGRGRLALVSAKGEWLGTYYVSYPRFHRVIDWDGDGVLELAIPSDGVLCDGRGQTVVRLARAPRLSAAGMETPMARVADVLGDGRDELVLYNAREVLVYANPEPSRRPIESKPVVMKRYYNPTYY